MQEGAQSSSLPALGRVRGSLVLPRAGGCGGGRQLGQYPPDARWPTPTPTRTQTYIHLCTQMYNPAPLGRERVAPFSPSASDFDPPSLPPSTRYTQSYRATFCAIHSRLRGHRTSSLLSARVTRSKRVPLYHAKRPRKFNYIFFSNDISSIFISPHN